MLDTPWLDHLPRAHTAFTDPGQVIATLPYQLGYRPTDTVALTVWSGGEFDTALTAVSGTDEHERLQTHRLVRLCAGCPRSLVALTVIGRRRDTDTAPRVRPRVARHLLAELTQAGIVTAPVRWTPQVTVAAPWFTYGGGDRGTVADLRRSTLVAAATACGYDYYDSEQDLEAVVRPDPPALLARRAGALDTYNAAMWADERGRDAWPSPSRRRYELVMRHIEQARDRVTLLEDDEVAALASALCDHKVCTRLLSLVGDARAAEAEHLWAELTRAALTPEVAEPATLLAWHALWRGDRALATRAVHRAQSAFPTHRMSLLLGHAARAAIPIAGFHLIAEQAEQTSLD